MDNILDFAEYKKRRMKQKRLNFIRQYRKYLIFGLLSLILSAVWFFISLEAALFSLGVFVLIPAIFMKNTESEPVGYRESTQNKAPL